MLTSFYNCAELLEMGFASIGKKVKLSRKASFYNPNRISIGDFSRIDDFCVLSAGASGIEIGRNVHIAVYTSLIGKEMIKIGNFSNLSSRIAIYSSSDDYSGEFMTNPTIGDEFTNVSSAPVEIGENVIIGCGSIVLPGVTIHDGVSVGALSMVHKDCEAYKIYAGVPAKIIKDRSKKHLDLVKRFLENSSSS